MIPYILIFAAVIGLTYIGQKNLSNKKAVIAVSVVAILTLSLFAAFRDYSVGADLLAHKRTYFDTAIQHNSVFGYLKTFNDEYFFEIFVYTFAHIFGSYRLLMFMFTFIPLTVLYYYGWKKCPKRMTLFITIFLLMYFNTSLNIIRQTMAIACIIPAFFLIRDNRKIKALLLILAATLFHTSAILLLVLYPIYFFAKKKNQIKYYAIICLLFIIGCSVLNLLSNQSIISSMGYAGYLRRGDTNMNLPFFILKTCIFIFTTYFYKYFKTDNLCRNYHYLILLDLLFYFFSNFVIYGYRLSYYFVVFYPFLIASMAEKVNGRDRILLYVGSTIAFSLYWVDRNIIIGYDSTIPYILGTY